MMTDQAWGWVVVKVCEAATCCLFACVTDLSTPLLPQLVHGFDLSCTVPYVKQQLGDLQDNNSACPAEQLSPGRAMARPVWGDHATTMPRSQ
jgi:hypothetical protein